MGMPARKMEMDDGARRVRPDLRLVKAAAPAKKGGASRKSKTSMAARKGHVSVAQQNFRLFVAVVSVVAVLGLGRVWLSVLAAEASLEASQLRHDIKNERYVGDMLEIQQSALSSPSRIRAVASAAFDMVPAEDVTYVDIRDAKPVVKVAANQPAERSGKVKSMMDDVLELTAGEAQVLLVGDVGLAAAR